MEIHTIGIIGAGIMGQGISQILAETDHLVILHDISPKNLEKAREELKKNIRMQVLFKPTDEHHDIESTLNSITFTTDFQALQKIDYVIENVPEKGVYGRKSGKGFYQYSLEEQNNLKKNDMQ